MKNSPFIFLGLGIIFLMFLIGCSSKNSDPISIPNENLSDSLSVPASGDELKGHELLGIYNAKFDLSSMTVSVEQDRETTFHMNVKPYIPAPTIQIISWDPVNEAISVDVTIRNPYNINGYDVRLIIYTDNIGHTLINDDNWTSLYDITGGMNINPFKAYAIKVAQRQFAAYYSEKVRCLVRLPGGNPYVKFAIDASYPGNCVEPYEILNFTQGELFDKKNSIAPVSFYVNRWDPTATLTAFIECPDIFGSVIMQMPPPSGNHFQGNIVNYEGAEAGEHMGWIKSKTQYSDLYLYEVIKIDVHAYPDNGWVVQQYENQATEVETDLLENVYITTGPSLSLKKYDDASVLKWTRDLDAEDAYSSLKDLYFDGYLYIVGDHSFCVSTANPGYIGGMYGASNSRYWVNDYCLPSESPGSCIAGDGAGISYLGTAIYWGTLDSAITKYDVTGSELWNREFVSTEGGLVFSDILINDSESFYVTGAFWGTNCDFDPMVTEENIAAGGFLDGYLAKYDSNDCYFEDVVTWGGERNSIDVWDDVRPVRIAIDDSGYIFISGIFYGIADFDPGTSTKELHSDEGYNVFISKFDSNFNWINTIHFGNGQDLAGAAIALDPDGNIYVAGTFEGNVDLDPAGMAIDFKFSNGLTDFFLLKLTNNLEHVWARSWGGTGEDTGWDVACNKLTGAIYMVGSFSGTVDFNPGDGVYERTAVTSPDSFLMKVLSNGLWEN